MADANPPDVPSPIEESTGIPFPVVSIGASAGGLEAVTKLLESLPANPRMALLIVMHLDRHHRSSLPEILSRVTTLPVREAADGEKLEVNHVYIGSGGASLLVGDGVLTLTPRPPSGVYMPIDHLFRSLASVQKSRAVGVLLSGEGTDGALGFQAIKAEGGITFAQDAQTARHDAMPRSAVVDGTVDYVLPPEQIGRELVRIAGHAYSNVTTLPAIGTGEAIDQVIGLVRSHTDVDFAHYKRTTIQRRIQRRMALRNVENVEDYLRMLRTDSTELHGLYHDFLIRVTQFFRDPDSFEALKTIVFPALVASRTEGAPIRMWVAGCATGEEVYSLAICLLEFLGNRGGAGQLDTESHPFKILATDLNEDALDKARAGNYLDNIELDVSPERLRRFFIRNNGHYQINKAVREQCVFSRHNIAGDPPFSRLDLVSCRNVLIYMDAAMQRRVLPILHYALKPEGFLFLGGSESIGPFAELFAAVDARHRIFSKKQTTTGLPIDFSLGFASEGLGRPSGIGGERATLWSGGDVQREADRLVLARYAPVGVVIDEAMTVVQFRGRTANYLEPAPGMASLDLLRMLRPGLLADVRSAITQARAENGPVSKEGIRLTDVSAAHIDSTDIDMCGAYAVRQVRVEVIPFKVPPSGVRFFLVLFQDMRDTEVPRPPIAPAQVSMPDQTVVQSQQELAALREYLQSVIEEHESTNEELKSANEEILSTNEELQSTNEELQTAKEEAQSANEELVTVNEELRHRNAELARVNNDLVNLLSGVNIPIVMVSRELRIRRFTPLAEKIFNLIPTDLGRPITDIKSNLREVDLPRLITRVIDSLAPSESEVQDLEGRSFSLRIRPYITLDNKIDGASIVLLDIDAIKSSGVRGQESGVRNQEKTTMPADS